VATVHGGCFVFNAGVFFTKNGKHIGGSFRLPTVQRLFPAVGLDIKGKIRINLGSAPFLFSLPDALSCMFADDCRSRSLGPPRAVNANSSQLAVFDGSEDGESTGSWQDEGDTEDEGHEWRDSQGEEDSEDEEDYSEDERNSHEDTGTGYHPPEYGTYSGQIGGETDSGSSGSKSPITDSKDEGEDGRR
jgi:hypothetical protein